ncbi:hypothetical protein GPECTOR_50g560 [Gonium pectorale]|uniref:N-acetyltransferase domain-containing protein n=1 Tax=Gonium pectorale TaxID=33097 RepID=A0A150G7E6_GONPE|nr:hypothetical protein GPECTOR_50g560 [Gonium pectorale]|eukprot:KXZ45767.1 hypothetical protein GPECTOR_50g560 [Gonium pectorale]
MPYGTPGVAVAASSYSSAPESSDGDAEASTSQHTPPLAVDAVFGARAGRRWRVRPFDNSDFAAIVDVQTDSFHNANPVPFLNDLTYRLFRAEVVDAVKQKTKYLSSTGDIFQLLVAEQVPDEPAAGAGAASDGGGDGTSDGGAASTASRGGALVGSVEVSRLAEPGVLQALPRGITEYVYVSSMCVRRSLRRRGAAQALLAAAEAQARLWGRTHLALHVYKDNTAAVKLYSDWGMAVVKSDPEWKKLLGDRVRLLMYKPVPSASGPEGGAEGTGASAGVAREGAAAAGSGGGGGSAGPQTTLLQMAVGFVFVSAVAGVLLSSGVV